MSVKCYHAPKGECNASTQCKPILNGYVCPRLRDSSLLRHFNPAREIAIIWAVDDVNDSRPELTDEQKMHVLEEVLDNHNAEWGVSWDTLSTTADLLYPKGSVEQEEE